MAYYECTNSVERTQTVSKTLTYPRFGGGAVDFIFDNLSEVKGIISSSSVTSDSIGWAVMSILEFTISGNVVKTYIASGDSNARTNTVTITAIGK